MKPYGGIEEPQADQRDLSAPWRESQGRRIRGGKQRSDQEVASTWVVLTG